MPDTTVSSIILSPAGSAGGLSTATTGAIRSGVTGSEKSFLSALQSVTPSSAQVGVGDASLEPAMQTTSPTSVVDVSVDGVFQFRFALMNKLAAQKSDIESESLPPMLTPSEPATVTHELKPLKLSLPELISGSEVEGGSSVLTDSLSASSALLDNAAESNGDEFISSATEVTLVAGLDDAEWPVMLNGYLVGYSNHLEVFREPQVAIGAAAQNLSWANRPAGAQSPFASSLLGEGMAVQTSASTTTQTPVLSSNLLNPTAGANLSASGLPLQGVTEAALGEFVELTETPTEASAFKLDSRSVATTSSLSIPGQNPELRFAGERVQVSADVQFSNQQWPSAMAEKAAQLVSQRISTADIQLDPPELGPLQVRVQVHQDQVSVNFIAQNAQVRDALDLSLARLRDMLQDQGFSMVDSGVSDQSANEGGADQDSQHSGQSMAGGIVSEEDVTEASLSQTITVPWGVDHFV